MNINIQLDLNQPISLLQDYARGLAYLRLDDESQKMDEIMGTNESEAAVLTLKNAIYNHTVIRNL